MFLSVRKLVQRLAELCNCPYCGSASYYHNGKNDVCMDCQGTW
ncbi:hypothetical protein [Streptomyces sp. NPDC012825]